MKLLIFVGLVSLCVGASVSIDLHEHNKVVCFWNSTSFERQGLGKFGISELEPAFSFCTHLIYGYAGINAKNHEIESLHPNLDTGRHNLYGKVTELKKWYPDLKVYLSIGGNADPYEETHKYLTVTESTEERSKFVNSVVRFLNIHDFDGIDLAWQFPEVKIKKKRGKFGSFLHGIKKKFGYVNFKDEKEAAHRDGFTILVRELKKQLVLKDKKLTLTVLPHVNATVYYDARKLASNIDAVHLMAFDQKTPERDPKEADYPAPIYHNNGRVADDNINFSVSYWLGHGTPESKIVVGIPTFARTWKLTPKSQTVSLPPYIADGPGAEGQLTRTPGFLTYPEVCAHFTGRPNEKVEKIIDPTKKYGSYLYLPYDSKKAADGMWIGYEEPDTAGNKAAYVKAKGLGGVAIFDLSCDDFRGTCNDEKFPIVSMAKNRL